MRALVTGAAGFIGGALTRQLLAAGHQVVAVVRRDVPALRAAGVALHHIDLAAADGAAVAGALRQACDGCDVVYHVAARAGVAGPMTAFYAANVVATVRMLQAARAAAVAALVYTSTPSVVFGDEPIAGADESAPYPARLSSAYATTKALAERAVRQFADVPTVTIRPPLVWGPGDPHLIPRLVARARAGRLAQIGDGTNRVDVTFVENAAEAHRLAAAALLAGRIAGGRVFFIGQEQPVALWPFIGEILRRSGAPAVRRRLSPALAWQLAGAFEALAGITGREPPLTRLVVAQLSRDRWFDQTAARRELGYGPSISLEAGLEHTFPGTAMV
ncbi:MAG: NAD-dependent epimerase/dehydratase family protein [Chloroflexi bacterium]|nr:NAD-dependent epimerase/dehydratase family protein [Chloroflexota bacterium]